MVQGLLGLTVSVPYGGWMTHVSSDVLWWLGVLLSLIVLALVMWMFNE
jgi:hypothetical protein